MKAQVDYFQTILHTALALYFKQDSDYAALEDVPMPTDDHLEDLAGHDLQWEEHVILLLAIMPHIYPQALDLFFIQNKQLDRPYTEFGGWRGSVHSGFLPTGDTAAFLLAIGRADGRQLAVRLLSREHWFHQSNVLRLEAWGNGEPLLSGRLCLSEEFLAKLFGNNHYHPDYSVDFPAKRITTLLTWDDLVLPHYLSEELEDVSCWIAAGEQIRQQWGLERVIKPGLRCLFYGPPGTGKTLTATLLGKQHHLDVYRVDLSMTVSKYIGETEKNLAKVFDRAAHQRWILFFDEADALFGKRSETNSANDRHANQEVAYLLQRIEDFPGTVILASNLKDHIDEAFFRRFQTVLYFPMPDLAMRLQLWESMIPSAWQREDTPELLRLAASIDLSGGSIANVVQRCAIKLHGRDKPKLTEEILRYGLRAEQEKHGKLALQ